MTTDQLTLDDLLAPLTIPEPAPTLDEQFAAFRAANPTLERLLVRLAREFLAAGNKRVGMKQLWEVARWQYGVRTGSLPSLNNNLTSRWARALMADYPDLDGRFEVRRLPSQEST